MNSTRRQFLKGSGLALGALALPANWIADAAMLEPGMRSETKRELAQLVLKIARKLGASYADIRINRYRTEEISTREKRVLQVARDQNFGFGVRVLYKGAWGFAASPEVSAKRVRDIVREAVEVARANAPYVRRPIELVPVDAVDTTWRSAYETDPFAVPIEKKIEMLMAINEAAMSRKGVAYVDSFMTWVNEQKFFASTDGSFIEQDIMRGFPAFRVTAVDRGKGDFQTRDSLPQPRGIGYEYMSELDWLKEASIAGEEAVAKLNAKPVEAGKYDLILFPSNLWLTIHESVGHSTELDRALWWEANYAGTSFLTPDKTGKLKFGAEIVNFFADRTQPHGLATTGFDDEGVPGQKWHLVKDGIFVDWQTTRDLAPLVGRKSSYGCLYADSWGSVPFPRMPNVSLEPSPKNISADDLIKDVENGIAIHGRGSWSIDQQRYNFQFGGQTFWEIKHGKITGMLRDVAYQSRTTDFWNSCDGLGGNSTYELGGALNDGKGEPGQRNAVSHGCPVARFRDVTVLNTDSSAAKGGAECS
jgi:TldD protein